MEPKHMIAAVVCLAFVAGTAAAVVAGSDATLQQEGTASVTFENQTSNGTAVTIASANLSNGGYVVIHNASLDDGDAVGSVVGVSEYLEPGEYENLTVELAEPLSEDQRLIAMAHGDTNGNQTFDFVASDGSEDGPYLDEVGDPVTDDALVSVVAEPVETPTVTETPAGPTETETPAAPTETETSAGPIETETPTAPTETVTPPVTTETETPAAPTETETPAGPVETETPAGPEEPSAPEAAGFTVSNLSAPANASVGDVVNVTARISNPGNETATEPVEFRFQGFVVARTDVELGPGESTRVTFDVGTAFVAPGSYYHAVFTRSDGQVAQLNLSESFRVASLGAPETATVGDNLTVSADIENPNDFEANQSVAFRLDGQVIDRQRVTIDGGGTETVTFEVDTSDLVPGSYVHGVFTARNGTFAAITLESPSEPGTETPGTETPGTETPPVETTTQPTEETATEATPTAETVTEASPTEATETAGELTESPTEATPTEGT